MDKKAAVSYLSSISTILISTVFFLFPLFFLTNTTDFYSFPKQILIIGASLILFILWGVKSVVEGKITLLLNPLNIPLLIFTVIIIVSAVISPNKFDSVLQAVPVALLILFFFTVVNFINEKTSFTIALTSLIIGSVLSSILTVLSQFKIYALPFAATHNELFNPNGSQIQQLAFLTPLFVLCVASLTHIIRTGKLAAITRRADQMIQAVSALVIGAGIGAIFYQIINQAQKPILLPYNHGFQIALASVSQDAQRLLPSFLLGGGFGTFSTSFTKFILPSFNSSTAWNLAFPFSSSFVLELVASTGILGFVAFLFIVFKFVKTKTSVINPLFLATATTALLSFAIPFSYSMIFLFIALLALYITHLNLTNSKKVAEVAVNLVTLQKGLFSLTEDSTRRKTDNYVLPFIALVSAVLLAVFILFFMIGSGTAARKGYVQLLLSDIKFAKSLQPEALQSGSVTYNLQTEAIEQFPYRSDYYRVFSQVNLALAASLVNSQQGTAAPSQEVQQNILGLLQQSINSARQAVTLSGESAINWDNLAQIYRNLIGVGQNAEQFTIQSLNKAISLNPSNPALRIELGGVYYQLKQYDLAQNQFTIATQLKADYPNAYYNLGKSYEQKGDLQNAVQQFQVVRQLVINDTTNLAKIDEEIKALQTKIGEAAANGTDTSVAPTEDKTPLEVSQQKADFPEQDPRVKIPEPPTTKATPTPTSAEETPSPTPTQ